MGRKLQSYGITEVRNHGVLSAETQRVAIAVVATNEKAARTNVRTALVTCNL
jgi:hypothetical protein